MQRSIIGCRFSRRLGSFSEVWPGTEPMFGQPVSIRPTPIGREVSADSRRSSGRMGECLSRLALDPVIGSRSGEGLAKISTTGFQQFKYRTNHYFDRIIVGLNAFLLTGHLRMTNGRPEGPRQNLISEMSKVDLEQRLRDLHTTTGGLNIPQNRQDELSN
jgi:hypothetical protein